MNVFQVIDLFGKPIFLNFNGATRAKTHAGGVFSLLFFGFIIWSAYHVSQDLFEHANPQTLSSEFFSENPEQMILGPDTFTFGFGIQDPDTYAHYIDESVYTLNVIKNRLDNVMRSDGTVEQQWSSVNLETEICKTSHFGELADKFAGIELNQLFCFTPEQTGSGELRIQGVFESPVYEYISISITECNPAVRTCASEARRKALLEGGFFAIYFTNMAFDPKDYNQPSFRYRDSIYTTFGKNFFKEATMLLSHVQVTSDSGWVTREPQTKNFIKFESQRELFNLKSDLTDFFNFVIRVNKISEKHDRSYIKVQDIIAELNGLATIGLLAAFIIVSPYSNLKFYEGLINELFDIKMLKDLTQKLKQKQKKMLRKQMSLSHHIAQYIKPRSHDEDEDNMEKALEIMTPTKSPLKFDFDTGSPDLEEAKPEKEPRAHKEFNKKASFLRVTLEEGYNSPLAQYQQERQILANRNNNRKKTTTFHMGPIPEAITHSKVEAEPEEDIQRNNEVKAARGNLKKPSYYKAIMSDDINTLVVQTAEQQAREREASNSPKSRKKSSFNKPSIEHLHTPKSFKDKEGVKKQSFSKNSVPGNVNTPLADRQQQVGWEKDGESSKRTHKKSNAQKASITENLNTQPGDIDEYKDNRISSNLYSAELGKNPFSYKIEIKGREPELQQNHEMKRISSRGHGSPSSGRAHNKDIDQEGSAGLPGEKLQQDIPRAVKPSLRVMENERDMDSLDVILETIGLDNQQGGKESEEMERMEFTPGDMKSRSEVMDDDNKESREKADLVVSDQEGKNRAEEGSELRQEQLTTHAMLKVTDYDNIREPVGTVLNSYVENQQEKSQGDEENRVQLLTPSTDPKLNLVEYDNNREEVGIEVADRQESSGEGEHVKENTPSIRKDGVEMSVRKESKDAVRSRRLEDEDLISPSIVGIARNGGGKKTIVLREAHKLDLTFWEYIKSYVWKTAELKEKLSVLNEGRRRIDERLDIFNVFKKLREVDKLKLLLLENEQLVLFDGLPKPELKSKNCLDLEGSKSLSRHLLKDSRFISERRKQDLIAISYENLKEKPEITQIDQKLLDIYDDMAINT